MIYQNEKLFTTIHSRTNAVEDAAVRLNAVNQHHNDVTMNVYHKHQQLAAALNKKHSRSLFIENDAVPLNNQQDVFTNVQSQR